jgi:O-antigen/teichoic acid export membrane protein
MAVASLAVLLGNLDKALLTRLLPLDIFGYYALAFVVAQVPLGFVMPIAQAFYPKFTQLWASGDATLATDYHLGSQLVAVLLCSATAFLVILGRPVLMIWLHDAQMVDRVEALVAILSVGSMLNGLMTLPYFLQLAAGWTRLTITMNAFGLCIIAPALWLLVPRFGPLAAAWCWLALNASYLVVTVPLMHRRLLQGQMARWYLQDILPPAASACLVALAWRVVLPTPTGLGGWFWLAGAGVTVLVAAVVASPRVRTLVWQRLPL